VRILTKDNNEDWDAGARSIEYCHDCDVVHLRLYRSIDDKQALMCVDIPPEGLDSLIAELIRARNEWSASEITSMHEHETMQ